MCRVTCRPFRRHFDAHDAARTMKDGYDSDGCRVTRTSREIAESTARGRRRWTARCQDAEAAWRELADWTQTTTEVFVSVDLRECDASVRDLKVSFAPYSMEIWTTWGGRAEALSGTLSRRIKTSESTWSFDGDELMIELVKDDPDSVFQSVFEDGRSARTHAEVLKDMVDADEAYAPSDEISRESADLCQQMRERLGALARGEMLDPSDDLDFKLSLSLDGL